MRTGLQSSCEGRGLGWKQTRRARRLGAPGGSARTARRRGGADEHAAAFEPRDCDRQMPASETPAATYPATAPPRSSSSSSKRRRGIRGDPRTPRLPTRARRRGDHRARAQSPPRGQTRAQPLATARLRSATRLPRDRTPTPSDDWFHWRRWWAPQRRFDHAASLEWPTLDRLHLCLHLHCHLRRRRARHCGKWRSTRPAACPSGWPRAESPRTRVQPRTRRRTPSPPNRTLRSQRERSNERGRAGLVTHRKPGAPQAGPLAVQRRPPRRRPCRESRAQPTRRSRRAHPPPKSRPGATPDLSAARPPPQRRVGAGGGRWRARRPSRACRQARRLGVRGRGAHGTCARCQSRGQSWLADGSRTGPQTP